MEAASFLGDFLNSALVEPEWIVKGVRSVTVVAKKR